MILPINSRGEADPRKFSANKHIKGIKLHILPWSERSDSLTSKSLLAKAEFEYMGEVQTITQGNQSRVILIRPEDEDEE